MCSTALQSRAARDDAFGVLYDLSSTTFSARAAC